MTPDEHTNAARELLEAEHTGTQIGLLTQRYPQTDMDDAYCCSKGNPFSGPKMDAGQTAGWLEKCALNPYATITLCGHADGKLSV